MNGRVRRVKGFRQVADDIVVEFEERSTPHRFRHAFARIRLRRAVPMADVADLLGDDETTVRQHYARWVPERAGSAEEHSAGVVYRQAEAKAHP